jgi:predicted ATPase
VGSDWASTIHAMALDDVDNSPHEIQFRWRAFRKFSDTGWLRLRPLTVLIGPNNSGKSSLLAPFLLLKQTRQARDRDRQLITRGDLLNVGNFADLIYEGAEDRRLILGLRFRPVVESADLKPLQLDQNLIATCTLTFRPGEDEDAVLQRFTLSDVSDAPVITRTRFDHGGYSLETKLVGERALLQGSSLSAETAAAVRPIEEAVRDGRPNHFLFSGVPVLIAVVSALEERPDDPDVRAQVATFTSSAVRYAQVLNVVEERIGTFLDHLNYIGPLREHPQRLYELSSEMPANVHKTGKFAPEILFRNPELVKRVDGWLDRFSFDYKVSFKKGQENSFALVFRRSKGRDINFADAGFGLSQLLPLVVQGLSSPTGLIVAEQPEIHLNPRLQGLLADLFVDFASSGGGAVIETHSEHLLLRLRRLIAEGVIAPEKVGLYFVEGTERHGVTEVRISQDGGVERDQWPRGFFEDALRESLGLANAVARKTAAT